MVGQVSTSDVLLNEEQCKQYDNAVRMILENASQILDLFKNLPFFLLATWIFPEEWEVGCRKFDFFRSRFTTID